MADDDLAPEPTDGDAEYRDELPADLDVTGYVGPYLFPTMRRRRIPATMYLVLAALCVGGYAVSSNGGLLAAAIVLALIAAYHYASAWPLVIDQTEALLIASRTVGFAVGHSSAQLGVARPPRPPGVAHPPLQRRRTADDARPRADRRGRWHA